MNLAISLLQRLDEPRLNPAEKAQLRCALAKALEDGGSYEAASRGLGEYWQGVGVRPRLSGLDEAAQAELLLRAGALSGWLGSARQLPGAQEAAKDLLSESMARFETLGATAKAAEAQIETAWCYWREGAYDEARLLLRVALERLGAADSELRAVALVRCAEVERAAGRFHDALARLFEAEQLALASSTDALKGKFHSTLAATLDVIGVAEGRPDYIDRALIEFAAASFHFEQAGHARYCARVENNLGFLLYRLARFAEAHEHLRRARRLFVSLKEPGSTAQVDETIARALLAEGRAAEAEKSAAQAVRALAAGDELALLAEALTTHATALARLGRTTEARAAFERAQATAEHAGDGEGAGRAVLSLLEELRASLMPSERRTLYRQADALLARAQHVETLARLRACARELLDDSAPQTKSAAAHGFIHAAAQTAELLREARIVAAAEGAVLLSGETGTGKEVLARLVHEWSGRRGPFVAINCAALCATLFESQLFGHRKGSFTGATEDYTGAARAAEGGTLFLDEIGELDLANQAKLLRLIEQGEVYAVGSVLPERVNVRIVAATNHDLLQQVEHGLFRADLFYRLAGFHLMLAPLRERPDDIPALARHFIEAAARTHTKSVNFTPEAIEAMRALPLAGNVRELRALIERTYITAPDGATITSEAVETVALRGTHKAGFAEQWAGCSLEDEMLVHEGRLIRLALDSAQGSVTGAARLLRITHQGLAYILNGRQKGLLAGRKPARQRRVSLMRR
jgi:transcriptional regulator with GAF, ATPase, and Fis domain